MKSFLRELVLATVILTLPHGAVSQMLDENFAYAEGQLTNLNAGADVSQGAWVSFSGTGNPLMVVNGNLTYPGYPSSGIGKLLRVKSTSSSAEDAYTPFGPDSEGTTTFVSLLLRVDSTTGLSANTSANGGYFAALLPGTSTSAYVGRISIRKGTDGTKFQLGVRAKVQNAAAAWYATDLNPGEAYLVVLGYQMVSGDSNDVASLWVNPNLSGAVPPAHVSQASAGTGDPTEHARFAIRQDNTLTPSGQIDGIRISTVWSGAPLSVQMASFSAVRVQDLVQLRWTTFSEVNNYGFSVECRRDGDTAFTSIANAFVPGHGTTTEPHFYTFLDEEVRSGTWFYRLCQIDLNGSRTYVQPVRVDLLAWAAVAVPAEFSLSQNYPNPFNPATTIEFTLPGAGFTSLKVYDLLGREVASLLEGNAGPGLHRVVFDARALPTGMYICSLRAGAHVAASKLLLLR